MKSAYRATRPVWAGRSGHFSSDCGEEGSHRRCARCAQWSKTLGYGLGLNVWPCSSSSAPSSILFNEQHGVPPAYTPSRTGRVEAVEARKRKDGTSDNACRFNGLHCSSATSFGFCWDGIRESACYFYIQFQLLPLKHSAGLQNSLDGFGRGAHPLVSA